MSLIHYFVTDDNNVIIQTGTTQEEHLEDNAVPGTLHIGLAPAGPHKYVNEEFVPYERELTYEEQRRAAYPALTDQLDMFWHAMDQGLLNKVEPFYTELKVVKDTYPK